MPTGSLGEFVALIDNYIDDGMTDGLPVVPPTKDRVEAMIAASNRDPDEVLGLLPPTYDEATVRDVAVNATMAGCLPDYLPVILAAVEVMVEPSFHLDHLATSTKGNAPLIVVNGPVRHKIGLNCRKNVLGPGNRANATIGRAIRLLLINVITGRSEAFVLLNPDHRDALAEAGWSKADIRAFLFERSGRRAADLEAGQPPGKASGLPHLRELGAYGPDDWVSLFGSPDDIHIVAAGGEGIVSMVCYGSPSLDYGRHGMRRI